MEGKQEEKRYTSIVIDTLNGMQNDAYIDDLKKKGKLNFDDWKDYAIEIYDLFAYLKDLKCTIVLVLGVEGSGKTVGAYFLDPESTFYINADKKPLTFTNAYISYPENSNRYKIPKSGGEGYEQIKAWTKAIVEKKSEYPNITVFCLAHVDYFKDNGRDRQRMKTLGKMASKMNIEGSTVHTYYTEVDPDMSIKDEERYTMLTRNTGLNTGRSPMNFFKVDRIPNNFNLVLYKILKARGIDYKYQNKDIDNLIYDEF
jgi:hypothetical protein